MANPAVGGNVQTWLDLSGNGNSPTNVTTAQRPIYQAARELTFDAVDDGMNGPVAGMTIGQTPVSIYVVGRTTVTAPVANVRLVYVNVSSTVRCNFNITATTEAPHLVTSSANTGNFDQALYKSQQRQVFFASNDGISVCNCGLDGSVVTTTTASGFTSLSGRIIVGNPSAGSPMALCAILMYTVAHNKAQRRRVEQWLAARYGVTLARAA